MQRVIFIFCIVIYVFVPLSVSAETWSQVFQIIAEDCRLEPKRRYQSGFMLEGYDGMLTALHGIVDCKSVTARNFETEDVFHRLEYEEVDIENDIALLKSEKLNGADLEKLKKAENLDDTSELRIVGHPYSVIKQYNTPVELESKDKLLEHLIPVTGDTASRIKFRGSPAMGSAILSLNGDVLPGHSGAPILDTEGLVVGIGNGGLKSGTIGMAWGIPISEIDLQPKKDRMASIEHLKKINVDVLFDFETDEQLRFKTRPLQARIGKDVTLYFDNPIKDKIIVLLDGRELPRRMSINEKEVTITVPGDQESGKYYIEVKRWEDNITKSENTLEVVNPYDKFAFSVSPEKTKAGESVKLKMNDSIGKTLNIYLKKNGSSYQRQLFKKKISQNGKTISIDLPDELVEGMYTIEMTSHRSVHRYRSNSIYIEKPYRRRTPPPEAPQVPSSPGSLRLE